MLCDHVVSPSRRRDLNLIAHKKLRHFTYYLSDTASLGTAGKQSFLQFTADRGDPETKAGCGVLFERQHHKLDSTKKQNADLKLNICCLQIAYSLTD